MTNNFSIQKKISLLINGQQITADVYEEDYTIDNFLVVHNSNILTIVNYDDGSIFSKYGKIEQVYDCGKFFVMYDIFNNMGIIRYDGTIIVPFNYFKLAIDTNGNIYVWDLNDPTHYTIYSHINNFSKNK